MQQAQSTIQVKQGSYEAGFTVVHQGNNEAEALTKAKLMKKVKEEFILVTRGEHIVFCRY